MSGRDPLEVACRWKYCRSKVGQPCSTVAHDGLRRGDFVERKPHAVRVLPGLMGDVLCVNAMNQTVVSVDIDKAEAYASRVMKAREGTHG